MMKISKNTRQCVWEKTHWFSLTLCGIYRSEPSFQTGCFSDQPTHLGWGAVTHGCPFHYSIPAGQRKQTQQYFSLGSILLFILIWKVCAYVHTLIIKKFICMVLCVILLVPASGLKTDFATEIQWHQSLTLYIPFQHEKLQKRTS